MVALPLYADQPANAQRLAELGVGVVLRPDEADATARTASFGHVKQSCGP